MSSKHCRVDAVVPSLTKQYGALTTVSKSSMSDDKLFNYFDERLQGREREMVCGNKNCICLDIVRLLQITWYGSSRRISMSKIQQSWSGTEM